MDHGSDPSKLTRSGGDFEFQLAQMRTEISRLSTGYLDLSERFAASETSRVKVERELASTKAELASTKAELASTKAELASTKAELEKTKIKEGVLLEQIDDLKESLRNTTAELRKAMGLRPTSEGINTLTSTQDDDGPKDSSGSSPPCSRCPLDNLKKYRRLGTLQKLLARKRAQDAKCQGFNQRTMTRQGWYRFQGSNFGLIPVSEDSMRSKLATEKSQKEVFMVSMEQRHEAFGKVMGLSSSKDQPGRWDMEIVVTRIECVHETLTDPETGKSFRAGELVLGPKGFNITWRALTQLCLMIAEYGIPMDRIGKMLGVPYFSSSNISRWLQIVAGHALPIYLEIFRRLSKCRFYRMDDTFTLVLAMREAAEKPDFRADADYSAEEFEDLLAALEAKDSQDKRPSLVAPVARVMGRVAQYVNGDGGKKGINLTLISGNPAPSDSRQTLFFFRTHFGQAGNLLSRILEEKKVDADIEIFVQSDQAYQNRVESSVARRIKIVPVACYAHARRNFAKHIDNDPELCYYLMRGFLLIAAYEEKAFSGKITEERILSHRRREKIVWQSILVVCQHVVEGKQHPFAKNKMWKKKSALYRAAQYIIKNYAALTVYLEHAEIFAENNGIERWLRPEKAIEDTSKFRFSEHGRVALDITRTLIATCRAAEVDFQTFLTTILKASADEIKAEPAKYLPQAFIAQPN